MNNRKNNSCLGCMLGYLILFLFENYVSFQTIFFLDEKGHHGFKLIIDCDRDMIDKIEKTFEIEPDDDTDGVVQDEHQTKRPSVYTFDCIS